MQMLKKLFNSENKYFLELKESDAVQTAVETTKKVASAAKETASEVADTAQDKLESVISTEEKPAESKAKPQEKPEKSEAKVKTKGKSEAEDIKAKGKSKSEDKAEQNGATKNSEVQTVENTGASSYDPPFWVAAMYNNNSSQEANGNGRVAEQTFAPENLMPISTKFRRRPGGSLDKFKDMAKKANTPKG